jgi:tetratricopeptide (TPR) repeat protein
MLWPALWLAALPLAAQSTTTVTLDTEIAPIVEAIYDLRFDSAAAAALQLVAAHPRHPAGPFYEGLVAYQRFALEDSPTGIEIAGFQSRMREASVLGQAWISTDPAQGYYYMGASGGFDARYLASQNRYLKAMPEGLRSIRNLKKAVALDPKLEDAYLALGLYHYFRSRLPLLAKPFAFLLSGEWGTRELGLEELRRAAEKGTFCRTEARCALANIFLGENEKNWEGAETLLKELMDLHPHYVAYRLRRIYGAERRGAWPQAAELADPDGDWLSALDPGRRAEVRASAVYRAAEAWLLAGQPDKAQPLLAQLAELPPNSSLGSWALLRRANLLDSQNNASGAEELYHGVRDPEAARTARAFLKSRYPGGPKTVKPLTGLEAPS